MLSWIEKEDESITCMEATATCPPFFCCCLHRERDNPHTHTHTHTHQWNVAKYRFDDRFYDRTAVDVRIPLDLHSRPCCHFSIMAAVQTTWRFQSSHPPPPSYWPVIYYSNPIEYKQTNNQKRKMEFLFLVPSFWVSLEGGWKFHAPFLRWINQPARRSLAKRLERTGSRKAISPI